MKVGEIDIKELVRALGSERSKWINAAHAEGRKSTDAETVTICVLAALENALTDVWRNRR